MPADPQSVDSIFLAALEKSSPEERTAYLDVACGQDAELRNRVERLLDAHPKVAGFLETPAPGVSATVDQPASEQPGTYIGPYKLVEEIGEGGMGSVFLALQTEPVRRKVALKVIRPGMDSKQVISRFQAERQALAMMDHPNIARVFDGGATESGRPYFVMELVKGIPITDYSDRYRLTTRQRLELFEDVCRAVQHAHQKGIIHRDLKPSNILVTVLDGRAIPKVIDFGIAKAITGHLTDESMVTAFSQLVGTPMYMSPEQAEVSAADVDTRGDVYSLGVLLYELLTGTTPFDRERMSSVSVDELRRIVREEDPPRPSTRLSTLHAALTTIADKRHTDPRTLSHEVSGELDWIVMKALEKDRTRRYQTANDFAGDIQRYLNDDAVEACPPSKAYRLKKFVRRNRTAVLAAVAVGLALIVGAGVATWQSIRTTQALLREQEQRNEATRLGTLAERRRMQAEDNLQLAADAIDRTLRSVGADDHYHGEFRHAEQLYTIAVSFYEHLLQQGATPAIRCQAAWTYLQRSNVRRVAGEYEQSERDSQRAAGIFRDLLHQDPDNLAYAHGLRAGYTAIGDALSSLQRMEPAETAYRSACEIGEQLVAKAPGQVKYLDGWTTSLNNWGSVLYYLDRLDEAEAVYRRVQALEESLPPEVREEPKYVVDRGATLSNLAMILRDKGNAAESQRLLEEAIGCQRQALSADSTMQEAREFLYNHLWNLAWAHLAQDHHADAAATAASLAEEFPQRLQAYYEGAELLLECARSAAGASGAGENSAQRESTVQSYKERARQLLERSDGAAEATPPMLNALAWFLATCSEPDLRDTQRALNLAQQLVEKTPERADYWLTLGLAQYGLDRWQDAVDALQRAQQLNPTVGGRGGFVLAMAQWELGQKDAARQQYEEAVKWLAANPEHRGDTPIPADAAKLLGKEDEAETQGEEPSGGDVEKAVRSGPRHSAIHNPQFKIYGTKVPGEVQGGYQVLHRAGHLRAARSARSRR